MTNHSAFIRPASLSGTHLEGHIVGVSRAQIEAALGFAPQWEGDDRYGPCWEASYGPRTPFSLWDRGGSGERGVWSYWGHANTLRAIFGDAAVQPL